MQFVNSLHHINQRRIIMKTIHALIAVLTVAFLFLQPVRAQQKDMIEKPPAPTGFRGDFITQLNDVEKKIEDLAQAMPENDYSWRPMEGVRSVSEVYMHIAGANYLFPTFIGVKKPEGLEPNLEKNVTEKAKVI